MNYRKNSKVLETFLNDNGVMRFNLNSPENLNALSENMMDLIQNGLDKASLDKNVRVIIISGEGSTFSSGHDLKELKAARKGADKGKKYFLKIMKKCSRMMQTIIKCPKPIIAEVEGTAVPSTSAIIGFGHLIIVCIILEHFFIIFKKYFFPLSAPFLAAFNSFKSCPDENVDPSPEIIITLTFLSRLALSKPFCIKSIIFSERAFKFSGLFKLKRITPLSFKKVSKTLLFFL